jgi:adenylosuccinate synthase
MGKTVIVGSQWGDEGKGKVVDYLAPKYDSVVRFNGGNNAGHTVVVDQEKFKLSLLPSGILWQKRLLIAQGAVIDPQVLLEEIDFFQKKGIKPNLTIDFRTHIVMPYHQLMDKVTEVYKGKKAVGSLHLGIGYCYEDKSDRAGVRLEDLFLEKNLKERIDNAWELKKRQVTRVFGGQFALDKKKIIKKYLFYGRRLKKYQGDVARILLEASNENILFEGAHGTFLDPVFGTYPYAVACHTIASSVFPYCGIPASSLKVVGVVKAYTTRVGNGPFPTELFDETGERLRKQGGEIGTVSKRPRRCGWLDLSMIKSANLINGFSEIFLTKLDVLTEFRKIKVAVGYDKKGEPLYKEFSGWNEKISQIRNYRRLPKKTQKYIEFVENYLKVPIKHISVGPEREAVIRK